MKLGLALVFFIASNNCAEIRVCDPRRHGLDDIICVCNSTFCDDLVVVGGLDPCQAAVYETSKSGKRFKTSVANFEILERDEYDPETVIIKVNEKQRYQSIIGFGTSFTDSAGINLNLLSKATRDTLLQSHFSENGLQSNIGRVPIAASDFSLRFYTYDEVRDDFELKFFNLTGEDFALKMPHMRKANELSGHKLKFFACPWSPPSWMKQSESLLKGGPLKDDPKYHAVWANYLVRFLEEYDRSAISFWGLSIQNEPVFNFQMPFPSLRSDGKMQREFIKNHLGPVLQKSPIGKKLALMIFDDNRDKLLEFADVVLGDSEAEKYVAGTAVHWYQDNFSYPSTVTTELHFKYPEKFIFFTEATTGYLPDDLGPRLGNWTRAAMYARDIIEDLSHWASGWTDWNLCLDVSGGPTLLNSPVDAMILVNLTADEFYRQPTYYAFAHFSKFLPPGSQRIGVFFSKEAENFEAVALITPVGQRVLILNNRRQEPQNIVVMDASMGHRALALQVEAHSVVTVTWNSSEATSCKSNEVPHNLQSGSHSLWIEYHLYLLSCFSLWQYITSWLLLYA